MTTKIKSRETADEKAEREAFEARMAESSKQFYASLARWDARKAAGIPYEMCRMPNGTYRSFDSAEDEFFAECAIRSGDGSASRGY